MNWNQLAKRIEEEIVPGRTAILKSDGNERRPVTSNDGAVIGMRCGRTTKTVHTISYDMLRHAFEVLRKKGKFDSRDFREKYAKEYDNATCRYSMAGGVLVELGLAKRIVMAPNRCHYILLETR